MKYFLKILIVLVLLGGICQAIPQFWKLNSLNERDLFILDIKGTMAAGICYKQVSRKTNDPQFSLRTLSYCCPGYERNPYSTHSVKCDPICTEDCSNGICSAPDVCECYPGYERKGGRCESYY